MKQEKPGNILIAEDNLITQKLLGSIIANLGFNVSIVSDGIEVLSKLREEDYDVLILDYQMPLMDGLDTVKAIGEDEKLKNKVPIIMLTGEINEVVLSQLEDPDISCILKKPIQQEVLSTMVTQLVKRKNNLKHKTFASTKYLQKITHSNKEMMVDIIDVFIEESPKNVNRMMKYCLMEDWDNLKKLVHKIKANYTYVGIREQEEILNDLEWYLERNVYTDTYAAKVMELGEITKNAIKVLNKKKILLTSRI